jgi:hypothetical protein
MNRNLTCLKICLIIGLIWTFASSVYSQAFRRAYLPNSSYSTDVLELSNGDLLMVGGTKSDSSLFLQKVAPNGMPIWVQHQQLNGAQAMEACQLANGGFVLLCKDFLAPPLKRNLLVMVDDSGIIQWQIVLENDFLSNGFSSLTSTLDGGVAVAGIKRSFNPDVEQDVQVLKFDSLGTSVWAYEFGYPNQDELVSDLIELPNGSLVLGGDTRDPVNPQSDLFMLRLSASGVQEWESVFARPNYQSGIKLLQNSNGELVFLCESLFQDPAKYAFLRADTDGQEIGFHEFYEAASSLGVLNVVRTFCVDAASNLYIPIFSNIGNGGASMFLKVSSEGVLVWEHQGNVTDVFNEILISQNSDFVLAGEKSVASQAILARTDLDFTFVDFFNTISGVFYIDENLNCQEDTLEAGPALFLIQAQNQFGESYYTNLNTGTSSDGSWSMVVSSGDFTITAQALNGANNLWMMCDTPSIAVTGFNQLYTVPAIGVQPTEFCSNLEVQLGSTPMRVCTTGYVQVNYCNYGTIDAQDAYVELVMDSLHTFVSSGLPLGWQSGDTLHFELGTIPVGHCGEFWISLSLSCDAELGDAICTEAHIYPNLQCDTSNWNGSYLVVDGYCDDDDVHFVISNQGIGNTINSVDYVIIEDQIMLDYSTINLDAGKDTTLTISQATGYSYYIQVNQADDYPGIGKPAMALTGCNGGIGQNLSLFLPQGDEDPFVDVLCRPVVSSFDPNDKTGYPLGWTDDNLIEKDQWLDYEIRFQNTGNDTAFLVQIRDSLPIELDMLSFRPGPASHPYTYSLSESGRLQFTFQQILLPDSTTNEPESHGFVQFTIRPKPDLALGTTIENSAAIYFDYNEPVITNITYHQIGEPFIVSNSVMQPIYAGELQVSPNPFSNVCMVSIMGAKTDGKSQLQLFSLDGQLVRQSQITGAVGFIDGSTLPNGIYLCKVISADGMVYQSKLSILH